MTDRTVSVRLKAEVATYVQGMNKAAAATRSLADDAKRHVGNVSRSLAGMSRGAQLVGAVGAVALGRQFVNAASSMNETMSKTGVVFGDASAAVVDWSKQSAKAMGMSQQQAQEAASTFGNLFVSMRIGQAPAANMSRQLVQLAGDLASFNNTDPTQALEALRSGLVGEVEPLRRYGVNLSEVTLKQKAMELGLVSTTTGVLPPAIRTQAAYALILEQTKTAQGDYARTADGLANSQRTLNAEWQNTQAQLGQELLPAVNATTKGLTGMLSVANSMPEPLRVVAVGAGIAGAAFVLLAPRAVDALDALKQIETASPRAGAALRGLGKAVGAYTAVATTAALATQPMRDEIDRLIPDTAALERTMLAYANGGMKWFTSSTFDGANAVNQFSAALDKGFNNRILDNLLNTATLGVVDDPRLAAAGKFIENYDAAAAALVAKGDVAAARTNVEALTKALAAQGYSADQVASLMPQYASALAESGSATTSLGTAAADASTEVKSLADQIDGLRGTQMSNDEATSNLEAAIDRATASVKENGKAFTLTTEKGRANQQALRDLASAALDGVEAWNANGASATAIAAKTQEARDAFVRAAIQMGATKAQAEKLATAYGLIPKTVATTVTAAAGPALAAADAVKRRWMATVAYIDAHPAKYRSMMGAATGGYVAGFAGGGPVSGGGSSTSDSINARLSNGEYVVNAQATAANRPLLDAMNYGTRSVSSSSPRGYSGGGTDTLTVSAPVVLSLDSQEVWRGLLRLKRGRGGASLDLA